jgi:glycosyltransferase involved in cell wall biosynthesis
VNVSAPSIKCGIPAYEIVLVDDGSKDDSQQVVEEWLKERGTYAGDYVATEGTQLIAGLGRLPDFISVIQPNMGLSYARNAGAAAARGEVFAYTDSDCMPDADGCITWWAH